MYFFSSFLGLQQRDLVKSMAGWGRVNVPGTVYLVDLTPSQESSACGSSRIVCAVDMTKNASKRRAPNLFDFSFRKEKREKEKNQCPQMNEMKNKQRKT
jgi:hypothetical protein